MIHKVVTSSTFHSWGKWINTELTWKHTQENRRVITLHGNSCTHQIKQTTILFTLLTFIPTEGIPAVAGDARARHKLYRLDPRRLSNSRLGLETYLAADEKKKSSQARVSGLIRQLWKEISLLFHHCLEVWLFIFPVICRFSPPLFLLLWSLLPVLCRVWAHNYKLQASATFSSTASALDSPAHVNVTWRVQHIFHATGE